MANVSHVAIRMAKLRETCTFDELVFYGTHFCESSWGKYVFISANLALKILSYPSLILDVDLVNDDYLLHNV